MRTKDLQRDFVAQRSHIRALSNVQAGQKRIRLILAEVGLADTSCVHHVSAEEE
jgi:hypothetical protein